MFLNIDLVLVLVPLKDHSSLFLPIEIIAYNFIPADKNADNSKMVQGDKNR